MQHWDRDPSSGDYKMGANNAPVQTDSLTIAAYHRIKTRREAGRDSRGQRTGWMYAPDSTYGSDLYTLKKRVNGVTDPLLERSVVDAVAPLVDDGRAHDTKVAIVGAERRGIEYSLTIFDRQNKPAQLVFTATGV
jgi:phage gp46-like protein